MFDVGGYKTSNFVVCLLITYVFDLSFDYLHVHVHQLWLLIDYIELSKWDCVTFQDAIIFGFVVEKKEVTKPRLMINGIIFFVWSC